MSAYNVDSAPPVPSLSMIWGVSMRLVRFLSLSALLIGVVPFTVGCGESTEVAVQPAAPVAIPPATPLPADKTKGGGAGSSGNSNFNPGANS